MADLSATIDPDGTGDYTSLNAGDTGEQQDLTDAGGDTFTFNCSSSSGGDDSTAVNLTGWTTAAANFLEVLGDHVSSAFDDSAYIRTASMSLFEEFTRITNVGFSLAATTAIAIGSGVTGPDIRISGCYFKGNSSGSVYAVDSGPDGTGTLKMWNCVINDYPRALNLNQQGGASISVFLENITVYNATSFGFMERASGAMTLGAKNCYIDSPDAFFGTWANDDAKNDYNVITENNAGEVAIGSNGAFNTTASFVDAAGDDLALKSDDTACIDQGQDLSAGDIGFNTDINAVARGATWDIGAYEFVAPAGGIVVLRRRRAA